MRPAGNGDLVALAAIGLGVVFNAAIARGDPWHSPPRPVESQVVAPVERNPLATPGVAFYASNLDDFDSALRADYGGRVHRDGDGIRLEAEDVTLHAGPFAPDGAHLVGVRLALVEATASGWREVRAGPTQPTAFELGGQTVRIPTLRLDIPTVDEAEMPGRWLAVVHVLRIPDGRTLDAVVHADEALLDRLMGWPAHAC